MGKIRFIQNLLRGVSKVLAAGKKPDIRETVVVQSESGGNLAALLKRGNMALKDRDWKKADNFFERVLNPDAERAEAYFGKVLAKEKCSTVWEFISQRQTGYISMYIKRRTNTLSEKNTS